LNLILFKRLVVAAALLASLVLVAIWLLMFSGPFSEPRGILLARVLSDHLGQEISIEGGLDVSLDTGVHVVAYDLLVLGSIVAGMGQTKIARLGLVIDWQGLRRKNLRLSDVHLDGVRIEKRTASNDKARPAKTVSRTGGSLAAGLTDLQDLITDHRIDISDFAFHYGSASNGLDLEIDLSSVVIAQHHSGVPWTLQGKGKLNGQALTVSGSHQADQHFELSAATDQIKAEIDGTAEPGGMESGYTAAISADVDDLPQLLDILKLQQSISGNGKASATYKSSNGKQSLDDLKAHLSLDSGESIDLTGQLETIHDLNNANLAVKISLYPPDALPAPAKLRRDLKLTGFDLELTAQPDGLPLRKMKIRTNGFVLNTHGKGPPPVTVSQIRITPDGLLDLGRMELRIGPPGNYFAILDGTIGDALRLRGIDFQATLAVPMNALLKPKPGPNADLTGKIVGGFHLAGDSTTLALSDLTVKSQGTDLVQLDVTAASGNVLTLSDISLDISADVRSGAKLLSALNLSAVPTGDIKFDAKLSSTGTKWQSHSRFSVAQSTMDMSLTADTGQAGSRLDGQVASPLIQLKDVRHVVAAVREIGLLGQGNDTSSGVFSDVTMEPVATQVFQSGTNMDVQIDLKKLEGVAGTSHIKTEFTLKQSEARLGPVKFDYDGGRFDVTGSVDVAKHPEIITVKGSADGWNLSTILQELNFKKHGSGILNAAINLSGAHRSVSEFARTASGDILISMQDGRIQTRLLDLAGLGVLPWLFSDAHGKVAPIACLRGPLRFDDGKINVREAALETDKVQVVANGFVDLRNQTIDVTGEPRPIGKPLSRSPWPFVVSGSLKHPKLRLNSGAHRQRRSDGASTMPAQRKPCVPDILQLR
jgi:uncharacterized protein involved in outer membrane biogenesis